MVNKTITLYVNFLTSLWRLSHHSSNALISSIVPDLGSLVAIGKFKVSGTFSSLFPLSKYVLDLTFLCPAPTTSHESRATNKGDARPENLGKFKVSGTFSSLFPLSKYVQDFNYPCPAPTRLVLWLPLIFRRLFTRLRRARPPALTLRLFRKVSAVAFSLPSLPIFHFPLCP